MLNPEGSGKFPASHLSLISLCIMFFPLYCLTCWEGSRITDFPDDRSDRSAGTAGRWKGFGMGYQRTESARSWPEHATSSKPLLLAASQLPHVSKMWVTAFPALSQVRGAVGMKTRVSGIATHYCGNTACRSPLQEETHKNLGARWN